MPRRESKACVSDETGGIPQSCVGADMATAAPTISRNWTPIGPQCMEKPDPCATYPGKSKSVVGVTGFGPATPTSRTQQLAIAFTFCVPHSAFQDPSQPGAVLRGCWRCFSEAHHITLGSRANRNRKGYRTLNAHWRTGTSGSTSSTRSAAISAMRCPPSLGNGAFVPCLRDTRLPKRCYISLPRPI